jgi:hypothetical protein
MNGDSGILKDGSRVLWLLAALAATAAIIAGMAAVVLWAAPATAAGASSAPAPASAPAITISPAQVKECFGGRAARMTILCPHEGTRINLGPKKTGQQATIYMLDFSQPKLELTAVAADAITSMSDPFISPDGTRLAYGTKDRELVICRLAKGGPERTVVAKAATGFDARWWVHPKTGDEYIIYGDSLWENGQDIAGKTMIQKIRKGACAADGEAKVLLAQYRMCGGRTPSGKYICTTLPGYHVAEFADPLATENAQVKFLVDGPSGNPAKCNGSMCPDDSKGPLMIWEEKTHQNICYGLGDQKAQSYSNPKKSGYEGTGIVQLCEWSTSAEYITCIWSSASRDTVKKPMRPFILNVAQDKWCEVADSGDATHLWVSPR